MQAKGDADFQKVIYFFRYGIVWTCSRQEESHQPRRASNLSGKRTIRHHDESDRPIQQDASGDGEKSGEDKKREEAQTTELSR